MNLTSLIEYLKTGLLLASLFAVVAKLLQVGVTALFRAYQEASLLGHYVYYYRDFREWYQADRVRKKIAHTKSAPVIQLVSKRPSVPPPTDPAS